MRIGIDVTALPSEPVGAGNYMIHLVRSLAKLESRHELIVFAHRSGVSLLGVQECPGLRLVVLPDTAPAQRLLWEQVALPRMVRQIGLDLLHCPHYTMPLARPCPVVVTFHDMTFFLFPRLHTRARRLFFPLAIRASARKADALLAISESTRQDAIRLLGVSPAKITTTPLGISADFRPVGDARQLEIVRQRYHLPAEFILYVGLVEPRKNLPILLEAYRQLMERCVPPALVIVGRLGWMYAEVFQQVEHLSLGERVFFAGYVAPSDLPIVYNLASLFVYPSKYEGFGLPPLEAMACGTPVITTAVSSMPEIAGDAALLVPPGEVDPLVDAMQSALADDALRQEMKRRGLERATLFSWERTARETLQVYESLGI